MTRILVRKQSDFVLMATDRRAPRMIQSEAPVAYDGEKLVLFDQLRLGFAIARYGEVLTSLENHELMKVAEHLRTLFSGRPEGYLYDIRDVEMICRDYFTPLVNLQMNLNFAEHGGIGPNDVLRLYIALFNNGGPSAMRITIPRVEPNDSTSFLTECGILLPPNEDRAKLAKDAQRRIREIELMTFGVADVPVCIGVVDRSGAKPFSS